MWTSMRQAVEDHRSAIIRWLDFVCEMPDKGWSVRRERRAEDSGAGPALSNWAAMWQLWVQLAGKGMDGWDGRNGPDRCTHGHARTLSPKPCIASAMAVSAVNVHSWQNSLLEHCKQAQHISWLQSGSNVRAAVWVPHWIQLTGEHWTALPEWSLTGRSLGPVRTGHCIRHACSIAQPASRQVQDMHMPPDLRNCSLHTPVYGASELCHWGTINKSGFVHFAHFIAHSCYNVRSSHCLHRCQCCRAKRYLLGKTWFRSRIPEKVENCNHRVGKEEPWFFTLNSLTTVALQKSKAKLNVNIADCTTIDGNLYCQNVKVIQWSGFSVD